MSSPEPQEDTPWECVGMASPSGEQRHSLQSLGELYTVGTLSVLSIRKDDGTLQVGRKYVCNKMYMAISSTFPPSTAGI